MPFDNNLSERDLRLRKLKQKISGTFRTFEGLESFYRTRSYVATVRKNGLSPFEALQRVFAGATVHPVIPRPTPAPAGSDVACNRRLSSCLEGKKVFEHHTIKVNQPLWATLEPEVIDRALNCEFRNPGTLPFFALNAIVIGRK